MFVDMSDQVHQRQEKLCSSHTSEEGCIEFAVTIMTIFRDLTIVNNDIGNDAESTTEGISTTEGSSMMAAITEIR